MGAATRVWKAPPCVLPGVAWCSVVNHETRGKARAWIKKQTVMTTKIWTLPGAPGPCLTFLVLHRRGYGGYRRHVWGPPKTRPASRDGTARDGTTERETEHGSMDIYDFEVIQTAETLPGRCGAVLASWCCTRDILSPCPSTAQPPSASASTCRPPSPPTSSSSPRTLGSPRPRGLRRYSRPPSARSCPGGKHGTHEGRPRGEALPLSSD